MPEGFHGGWLTGSQLLAETDAYLERRRKPPSVEHAHFSLRQALGPLDPGHLVVVSGNMHAGKSMFAFDLCRSTTIDQGLSCLLVSRDIPALVGARLLSAQARVDGIALRSGGLGPSEQKRLAEACKQIEAANLLVLPTPPDVGSMMHAVCEAWLECDVDLVIVDDADLIGPGRDIGRDVYDSLSIIATELSVPVVMTTRSLVGDIGCGTAHAVGDMLIAIHRPDLDEGGNSSRPGEVDLRVRRSGEDLVTIQMLWQGHQSRYSEMVPYT